MNTPNVGIGNNRRNYFRIDDNVVMTYRQISDEELPHILNSVTKVTNNGTTLTATFAEISQKTGYLKKAIRRQSRALADYLESIEDKLDMLARALMLRDMGISEEDTHAVNLSAGGIEFHSDERVRVGSMLELKFVVFPSRRGILAAGHVIRCQADVPESPAYYTVAIEFDFIREADRQIIAKHVLSKQSSQLRRRSYRDTIDIVSRQSD